MVGFKSSNQRFKSRGFGVWSRDLGVLEFEAGVLESGAAKKGFLFIRYEFSQNQKFGRNYHGSMKVDKKCR